MADLGSLVPSGARLLLDTSILISYLGADAAERRLATPVLELVESGRNPAIVSVVSVMEVLVRPIRAAASADQQRILGFLQYFPNLDVHRIDVTIAREAAALRALFGLAAADALIVGTALATGARHVVTSDAEWARRLTSLRERITVHSLRSVRSSSQ